MSTASRIATLALTLTLALPALAHAALRPGDGLRMAEQRVPSRCAGHTTILQDASIAQRGSEGEASGMSFDNGRWHTVRCEFTVLPGLSPTARCHAEVHEYMHLALEQGEHTGWLDPRVLEPIIAELCTPPLTVREEAIQLVRFDLHNPDSWTVRCSRTAPRMSCRALRAGSKTRRFKITVAQDGSMQSERAGKVSA